MLQAHLKYVLIPAASLPRVLRGIHRGSVDAVSDTFRFLPFIFPPTQSPCTVAGECCWNLRFFFLPNTETEGGRALKTDHCSIIYHKFEPHKWRKSFLSICVCCGTKTAPLVCGEQKWVHLTLQIHLHLHVKHTKLTCAMIYYSFISVYEQQSVTK